MIIFLYNIVGDDMRIFLGYIFAYISIFLILFLSSLFKNKEESQGIAKIFGYVIFLFIYYFFNKTINLIIFPATLLIIFFLLNKFKVFKVLTTDKKNWYQVLFYPLSLLVLSLITYFFNDFITSFMIGFITLSFSGLTIFASKFIKSKPIYEDITLPELFIIFSVIVISILGFVPVTNYIYVFLISLFGAFIYIYSKKGLDNIYLPLATAFLVYILFY